MAIWVNQALILRLWDRLEEAFELLKKQESLCLELGNRTGLAYCYWYWGFLAREQRDRKTERENKLVAALDILRITSPRKSSLSKYGSATVSMK
jgi:hypothetical protein